MSFQTSMYCLLFSMKLCTEWRPKLSRLKKDLHKLSLFLIHFSKKTTCFGAISEWVIFGWTVNWITVIVFFKLFHYIQYMTYFFTSTALVGKLLLKTRHTEVIVIFRDERLGSHWLLTALTQKARLMPAVAFVLHFTWS